MSDGDADRAPSVDYVNDPRVIATAPCFVWINATAGPRIPEKRRPLEMRRTAMKTASRRASHCFGPSLGSWLPSLRSS